MYKVFQWFSRSGNARRSDVAVGVAPTERLYVVGDVHGRNDLLVAMLENIFQDAQTITDERRPRLVFLGDYVDRGDHSSAVLDTLCALQNDEAWTCDFLMGNHEAAMLAFLADPVTGADWLNWGGRQTLTSYGLASVSCEPGASDLQEARDLLQAKLQAHLPFLKALKRYVVSGDIICAHASLDPALALEAQPDAALLWGQIPSSQDAGMPGHRLIHGHFADHDPIIRPERICVDTGAYYSGRLTAVRLDHTESFLRVDADELMA